MARGGSERNRVLSPAEKFQTEADAYRREAEFYRRQGNQAQYIGRKDIADRFATQILIVKSQGLSWNDIRTKEAYRGWLGTDWLTRDQQVPGVEQTAELDFDSETLNDIQNGARELDEHVRQAGSRRLAEGLESAAGTRARADGHRVLVAEAARCGLNPIDSWNFLYQTASGPYPERISLIWHDEAAFKATALLVDVCRLPAKGQAPCNDSFESMRERWDDEAFRRSLYLADDTAEDIRDCVGHIAVRVKRLKTYEKLVKEAKDYREWLAEHRREQSGKPPAAGSPPATGPAPSPRPPRQDPAPPARPRCRFMGDWCE